MSGLGREGWNLPRDKAIWGCASSDSSPKSLIKSKTSVEALRISRTSVVVKPSSYRNEAGYLNGSSPQIYEAQVFKMPTANLETKVQYRG